MSAYYRFKQGDILPCKTDLHRDFLILNEFYIDVAQIDAYPIEVEYTENNRQNVYRPDYVVYSSLGADHYEDYPKPKLTSIVNRSQWRENWRHYRAKYRAAKNAAIEMGAEFEVRHEDNIRGLALANIKFLNRYKSRQYDEVDNEWLLETVRQMGTVSFDYLLARHYVGDQGRGFGISHIWHLVATRKLDCDISQSLDHRTLLQLPSRTSVERAQALHASSAGRCALD